MDVYEWVRKALADPKLTPLRKLLRRRDIDPKLRSSVEGYIEAEESLRALVAWQQANSCTFSAEREGGDVPILAASNPGRWQDGRRLRQYDQLREIIEEIGCPLKRELIAKGFTDEEMNVRIVFSLKREPGGETFDVSPTVSQLDFDPTDRDRFAAELDAARRGGCDRDGIWHPALTLCGRVHGHFEENESREFEYSWMKKHGGYTRGIDLLLLDRVSVTITATPSDQRYLDSLPPPARRTAVGRRTHKEPVQSPPPMGPTVSASFLDFVEAKDPPIRFERGEPPPDGKMSRAVDRETGEYVEWDLPHWQSSTSYYLLYSASGTKIGTATVEQQTVDLRGDGTVGLYKVRVLKVDDLSGDGTWQQVVDGYSPIAQKFARFIAAFLVDHLPARHSAEITFDLGGKTSAG